MRFRKRLLFRVFRLLQCFVSLQGRWNMRLIMTMMLSLGSRVSYYAFKVELFFLDNRKWSFFVIFPAARIKNFRKASWHFQFNAVLFILCSSQNFVQKKKNLQETRGESLAVKWIFRITFGRLIVIYSAFVLSQEFSRA